MFFSLGFRNLLLAAGSQHVRLIINAFVLSKTPNPLAFLSNHYREQWLYR